MDAPRKIKQKLDGNYTRMRCVVLKNYVSSSQQKSSFKTTYLPLHKTFKEDEQDMRENVKQMKMYCYQ